jgi:quercetin dioxygenase-like cupin family protein
MKTIRIGYWKSSSSAAINNTTRVSARHRSSTNTNGKPLMSETYSLPTNFEADIPNIPGKSLIAVEVDYAPGAASVPHTHAKSAFIYAYVVSGAIESKVNDGETRIYREGESWSEPPGAVHSISRNASKTEPAKLLAVFVLDTNDKVLTTPIK